MRAYLKKVLELVKPYRFRFAMGLLCGFLSGALAFTLPLSLKFAVDNVFPESRPAQSDTAKSEKKLPLGLELPGWAKRATGAMGAFFHTPENPSRARVIVAISLIPGAMLIRGLLGYLNIYLLSWVGIRATNDLRVRVFEHITRLPMSFFGRVSTGDLMARLEGAMNVNGTINGSFGTIMREPVTILALIVYLVSSQPMLSLATLVVFPVCLVPVIIYGRKLRKSHSQIYLKFARAANVLHESFTGMRVIKAYNLEARAVEQYRQATRAMISFFMRSIRASELPGPMIEFIGAIGVSMIFVWFAFFAKTHAPVADLLAFFVAVFGLYAPFKSLSRLQSQITLARASVEPVYALLAVQNNLPEPAHPKPLRAAQAEIRYENVSFSYGDKPVLHDINLAIQPGQLVALVGRTGSGKTTLANLLLRFHDPGAGAVLIGGTDIRQVSSTDLRANIAVVSQETILFNDTIRNNISLGRLGATDAEIETAARHAYAHEFILEKPLGYETQAGEKGSNLSGGQRQRIAIARAILRNAPILILDEATSALDSEAEQIVQAALERLMANRTTICIAHRLSTIRRADLIVVMDNGRIAERGTHADLLTRGGIYAKLHELQFETA